MDHRKSIISPGSAYLLELRIYLHNSLASILLFHKTDRVPNLRNSLTWTSSNDCRQNIVQTAWIMKGFGICNTVLLKVFWQELRMILHKILRLRGASSPQNTLVIHSTKSKFMLLLPFLRGQVRFGLSFR